MRRILKPLVFGGSLFVLAMGATLPRRPAQAAPLDGVSLLRTLGEWQYPGSKLLDGASMSDAGDGRTQAVKCEATLTTPDPLDKVVAFYSEKLAAWKGVGKNQVAVQDDSKGRPLTLRVVTVNKADASTTLVISRAEGEKETHIVWSHCIRLGAGRAEAAAGRVRFSLGIYSGREDPIWIASEEDVTAFAAKFDAMRASNTQKPLAGALGYHGFRVEGFRSYERIWVWKGTVEATREGKTHRWVDDGQALERFLLEASKAHIGDQEFKVATAGIEKK